MATKKKVEKAGEAKKSVVARFKFRLDGKIVEKGEILELDKEKAQSLIERGFCEKK